MAFITSNTQPSDGALGDEWYNPVEDKIYKRVPFNGVAQWIEYNIPSLTAKRVITADVALPKLPLSSVKFLAVAGGGGSGFGAGSGAGGGGVLQSNNLLVAPGVVYTVVVGAGGAGSINVPAPSADLASGSRGSNTRITGGLLSLIAEGGGAGRGSGATYSSILHDGGSGGGAHASVSVGAGFNYSGSGAGTTIYYNYPLGLQGFPGGSGLGTGPTRSTGGGGGAAGIGQPSRASQTSGTATEAGRGGIGLHSTISGLSKYYGGGGGGGAWGPASASGDRLGGLGGGGHGGSVSVAGTAGNVNTGGGGGGGGGGPLGSSASGGSGIVIFSHPTKYANARITGDSVEVRSVRSNTELVYTFNSPGTIFFL